MRKHDGNICFALIWMSLLCFGLFLCKNEVCVANIEQPQNISIKQQEMLDTIVSVRTVNGNGSGTIIDVWETESKNVFEYIVLTNYHVTNSRFIERLLSVDSITGKIKTARINNGCNIVVLNPTDNNWYRYTANIIAEDPGYDLAMISFISDKQLSVALVADTKMLKQVRVFDEVFAVGCQLGGPPSPTTGIISQIIKGSYKQKEWILYGSTTQVSPGSSGGGLFKEYEGHYYLIGIPFMLLEADSGQFVPHLARAISISNAADLIDTNTVKCQ